MPTYEYVCTKCGEHLEVVQSFTDDPLERCPSCRGKLRKVFGAIGIVFKGSGFYKNDSRSKPSKTTSGSDASASADSSSTSDSGTAASSGATSSDGAGASKKAGDTKAGDTKDRGKKAGDKKASTTTKPSVAS